MKVTFVCLQSSGMLLFSVTSGGKCHRVWDHTSGLTGHWWQSSVPGIPFFRYHRLVFLFYDAECTFSSEDHFLMEEYSSKIPIFLASS